MPYPVVSIVVTVVGLLVGGALFYYLNGNSQQQQYFHGGHASGSTYNNLSIQEHPRPRKRKVQKKNTTCCICLEEVCVPHKQLDCGHEFHVECIQNWFQKSPGNCPLCRRRSERLN